MSGGNDYTYRGECDGSVISHVGDSNELHDLNFHNIGNFGGDWSHSLGMAGVNTWPGMIENGMASTGD